MKEDFKLKISKNNGEILIQGNKQGLEFLSDICRKVIGKTDPSGHFHISTKMGNASPGSEPAIVEFTDNNEDYK